MKARLSIAVAVVFVFASFAVADEVFTVPVALQPGVSADVAVQVIDNPHVVPPAIDVVLVHGLSQTGASFVPLANALFSDSMGNKVGHAIIINLPGHGLSAGPTGLPFAYLAFEDYAAAVTGVLGALRSHGMSSDVLIAHSMGGAIVQIAQEKLLSQGTSLRAKYGVKGAVLVAPVLPSNLPWAFTPIAQSVLGGLPPYADPVLGPAVNIPIGLWIFLFYSDQFGSVVPGTPILDIPQYVSVESIVAGAQTGRFIGSTPVRANAFGQQNGTDLAVLNLSRDGLFTEAEHRGLYEHLTGDASDRFFFRITSADAVHNVHTFDPAVLLHPIKKLINASDRQ
jgi:pimeloyl-ACP methyl ester carboxylesterase